MERGEARDASRGVDGRAGRAHGDASGCRHTSLGGCVARHGGEPLVRHQRLGAGVLQDVRHLTHRQVAVERDEVPPSLEQGHEHDDDLGPVGEQHRHRITRLQAPLPQGVHELVRLRVDVAGRPLPAVGIDDGETVRLRQSGGPEAPHLRRARHRGNPSTCSPTMFLLISVVPPAMEAWRTANRF